MRRLNGKIALITGTGGEQGRAAALLFAKEGARVVGSDVNQSAASETLKMVRDAGGEMVSMAPVDLSIESGASRWVEEGAAAFGGIDVLYNNASAPRFGLLDSMPVEDWHFTMRNELDIVYFVTRAAWPHLNSARWRIDHQHRLDSRGARVCRSAKRARSGESGGHFIDDFVSNRGRSSQDSREHHFAWTDRASAYAICPRGPQPSDEQARGKDPDGSYGAAAGGGVPGAVPRVR